MTVNKFYIVILILFGATFASCQKEPSTSDLRENYLVYTAHDAGTDFTGFDTYYMPDSILLIGSSNKTEYWKDNDALEVIGTIADNMDARGYTRVDEIADANLGIQLSFVKQVTYFVGHDHPYWWWYYPYYWTPGYWGDWVGWHYPYSVYYGYTSGSLLTEMLNLEADQESGKKLPVVWDSFIGGLLSGSTASSLERTLMAVDQAFEQSPYLKSSNF